MKPPAAAALLLLLGTAIGVPSRAQEGSDLAELNARIGTDYEAVVPYAELVQAALRQRLILYGEVHDQAEGTRNFLQLVESLRRGSSTPLRLGIEFVDRGDWDILVRYLQRTLREEDFLARLMPTSLLLYPGTGPSHLEILRYARQHRIDVLPLESRPAGARPMVLRNAEIRWNLATHLGRHATERLVVLYGVQHLFGPDAIVEGIQVPFLRVSAYGDSVIATYASRTGAYPEAGLVLRLGPDLYLQAVGGPPRDSPMLHVDLGGREALLLAIEDTYGGNWRSLGLLVEALGDSEVRWRRAAFEALRFAAERSFGYDPEAPPQSQYEPQVRWRAWVQRSQRRLVGTQ